MRASRDLLDVQLARAGRSLPLTAGITVDVGDKMTKGQPIPGTWTHLAAWRSRMAARDSVLRVAGKMASYLKANGIAPPPVDEWASTSVG